MIVFQNKGLINLRALKTFGVSAKDNPSAIGYFGTGLKYAIAILLRENCTITLYRGRKKYFFTAKKTKIRNDEFSIVCMNGEELGFTTALGKDWEVWQAFRELWCNTTDEGGVIARLETKGEAKATTITVEGEAFEEAYDKRETIILIDEPALRLNGVEVHHRPSEYLYYRGIRVQKLRHPSLLTYNITRTISLTEDRTVRYPWEPLNILKNAIVCSTELDFIKIILTAGEETYEHSFDFEDLSHEPGVMFMTAADDVKNKGNVNESAMRLCREAMRKEMETHQGQKLEGAPAAQLEQAEQFCSDVCSSVSSYEIIVVDGLGDSKLWVCEGQKIFLTPELFVKGTHALTCALIKATVPNNSVDILIDRLIALGEKITGEPLQKLSSPAPENNHQDEDEIPF